MHLLSPIEVYDITVPGTENFYLSSGNVVHNSKDITDAIAGAVYDAYCDVDHAAEPTKFTKTKVITNVSEMLTKVRKLKIDGGLNNRNMWT